MRILHLPTAICPRWHSCVAFRSLSVVTHSDLSYLTCYAWDFFALLQPLFSLLNRGLKLQLATRSNWHLQGLLEGVSPEGDLGAHGEGMVTDGQWWRK